MTYPDKTPVYTRTEVGIPPGGSKLNHPYVIRARGRPCFAKRLFFLANRGHSVG